MNIHISIIHIQSFDIDNRCSEALGNTLLHTAISHDETSIVKLLLEKHNANPNIVNNNNETTLMLCAEHSNLKIVELLTNINLTIQN